MTKNKKYTFSLPPEAGKIIDETPRMEKSKLVSHLQKHSPISPSIVGKLPSQLALSSK